MKIYSHRGESLLAKENTLKAFYLADILKSDGIECDIRKTNDNELVIIHDMSINRTSNGFGFVKNIDYNDLLKFNFGEKNNFEKIITLDEFLNIFSKKNLSLFIEVKESGYEENIINVLKKYNLNNITLISFSYKVISNIRNISKNIKVGWIIFDYNKKINNKAKEINIDNLIIPSLFITKERVNLIKQNGFRVSVWAITNITEVKKLKEIGVDNIIYDSAYKAKKYLGEL